MPSLNWIGKEKIVNHDKDVPFRLMCKNKKYSLGESENLILEGDNLEALKALMPFYYGKIKCIYIDPPYNTGNEKWVYNDKANSPKIKEWLGKVVGPEGEDLTRHDKWLCMMYPRLKLLADLLSNDGVIFVSIDDNEHCYLRQIMDMIFGPENLISSIVIYSNPRGRQSTANVALTHEYLLVYSKTNTGELSGEKLTDEQKSEYKLFDDNGLYREIGLRLRGGRATAEQSPTLHFPIYVDPKTSNIFLNPKKGRIKVIPKFEDGRLGTWRWSKKKIIHDMDKLIARPVRIKSGERWDIFEKDYLSDDKSLKVKSVWFEKEINYDNGADEIRNIFGKKLFNYSKPTALIKKILKITTDKNSIILDSFAGSGTTGHAVLDLNNEDGGNRKFILVELEKNIAKNITAERVKRVAKGYSYKTGKGKAVKVAGLGGGFEYVELGEPLFDKDGTINKAVSFEDMARYVYFTETRTNLEKKNIKGNYLGESGGNYYFLLFNGIGKNVLNRKFIKELKGMAGPAVAKAMAGKKKIIYADKCLLDEEVLEKHQIVFKQIPYAVKIY